MIYRLKWELDIEADTPENAARTAQKWMDEGDTCWVFEVTELGEHSTEVIGSSVIVDIGELMDADYERKNGPQE